MSRICGASTISMRWSTGSATPLTRTLSLPSFPDSKKDVALFLSFEPHPQLPHSGPLTSSTVPIGLLGPVPLEEPLPPDPGPLVPVLFVEVVLGILEDAHLGRVWYEFG